MDVLWGAFAIWLFCGVVALAIADSKGMDKTGAFLMGMFLGPLGIGIVLLMKATPPAAPQEQPAPLPLNADGSKPTYVQCDGCAAFVPSSSKFCPECGAAITGT